jgi:hypothetical protein
MKKLTEKNNQKKDTLFYTNYVIEKLRALKAYNKNKQQTNKQTNQQTKKTHNRKDSKNITYMQKHKH